MRTLAPLTIVLAALGCGAAEPAPVPASSSASPSESAAPAASTAGAAEAPAPSATAEAGAMPALLDSEQEAAMRQRLEPKVWGGTATLDEIRLLKAICGSHGDRACRDRASQALKGKLEGSTDPGDESVNAAAERVIRASLESKVWGGTATVEEVKMLKAICSHTGDRVCRDRAAAILDKTKAPSGKP